MSPYSSVYDVHTKVHTKYRGKKFVKCDLILYTFSYDLYHCEV